MKNPEAEKLIDRITLGLRRNISALICSFIAIALLTGVMMYMKELKRQKEISAYSLLEKAKQELRKGNNQEGTKYLNMLSEEYKNSSAYEEGLLYRARDEIGKGEHEKAEEFLLLYIEKYPEGGFLPEVYSELGFLNEEEGDYDEAFSYYSKVFYDFNNNYLAPVSMMNAARVSKESGDDKKAVEIYESLISFYPWSSFAEEAAAEIRKLRKPNLP
jgi:TolA-binding protein